MALPGCMISRAFVELERKSTNQHFRTFLIHAVPDGPAIDLAEGQLVGHVQPQTYSPTVNIAQASESGGIHISPLTASATEAISLELQQAIEDVVTATPGDTVTKDKLRQLLQKFHDVLGVGIDDLGHVSTVKHKITLQEGARPFYRMPFRANPKQAELIRQHLDQQLKSGVIRPSTSPWAAPVLLVPKKDGTLRFCVDFRGLNAVTKRESYPMPRIDTILDSLKGASVFSTLDALSGYWQFDMEEEDKEKTAFTTQFGHFEGNRMLFGLINAPATFQRAMDMILAGLLWHQVLCYIDDVLIFSNSVGEHFNQLQNVFMAFRAVGMRVKLPKCHFLFDKVLYLGFVVSGKGVSTDPRKVEVIRSCRPPVERSELHSFVGLASYYRRFIQNFASIAHPLTHMLSPSVTFDWTDDCATAFARLKTLLTSAPVLAFPDWSRDFIVDTDMSERALGAVLSQLGDDGLEHPIAFSSRLLLPAEINYDAPEREVLAAVWGIEYFKVYLWGYHFILRTDSTAVHSLLNLKNPSGRYARWMMRLQGLSFHIVQRPGVAHRNADGGISPTSGFHWGSGDQRTDSCSRAD